VGPEPHKLVVVDAPGYGARGRPEWGELFDHYTTNRREYVLTAMPCFSILKYCPLRLKRIFVLINTEHGLKEIDAMMLESLNHTCEASLPTDRPITLQAVLTKADLVKSGSRMQIQKLQSEIFEAAPLCLPAILTASSKHIQVGIEEVRRSITDGCGLGKTNAKVTRS
jgi:GTP-binding protein